MAFPVVNGRASGASAAVSTTTHGITLPASISAGELLLVVFSVATNVNITVDTGVSGSKWNKLAQGAQGGLPDNGGNVTGAVFWKIAEGSDVLTLKTSSARQSSHISLRISGANSAVGAWAQSSGTNSNPPSFTLPWGSAMDVLWIATRSGDTQIVATVAPTNYSNLQTQASTGAGGASTNTAEYSLNALTQNPGTFTSDAEQWVSFTIAVTDKPALPLELTTGVQVSNSGIASVNTAVAAPTSANSSVSSAVQIARSVSSAVGAAVQSIGSSNNASLAAGVATTYSATAGLTTRVGNFPSVSGTAFSDTEVFDSGTHEISLPSHVAGDILLVIFSCAKDPNVTVDTSVSTYGWTKIAQYSSGTDVTGAVLWKFAASSSELLTLKTSLNCQSSAIAYSIKGGYAVACEELVGNSANSNPPSHNPPWTLNDTLWIATRSGYGVPYPSVAPSGFTNLVVASTGLTTGANTAAAVYPARETTVNPSTFTSASAPWVSYTISVHSYGFGGTQAVDLGTAVANQNSASASFDTVISTGTVSAVSSVSAAVQVARTGGFPVLGTAVQTTGGNSPVSSVVSAAIRAGVVGPSASLSTSISASGFSATTSLGTVVQRADSATARFSTSILKFPELLGTATSVSAVGGATAHPILFPSGYSAGDLLVVIFSAASSGGVSNSVYGWNKLGLGRAGGFVTSVVYWKIAGTVETLTLNTGQQVESSAISYRFSGAAGVSGEFTSGNSANANSPGFTPPWDKEVTWISAVSVIGVAAATAAPTNFSDLVTVNGASASGVSTSAATYNSNDVFLNPDPFTSAAARWVGWTLTVSDQPAKAVDLSTTISQQNEVSSSLDAYVIAKGTAASSVGAVIQKLGTIARSMTAAVLVQGELTKSAFLSAGVFRQEVSQLTTLEISVLEQKTISPSLRAAVLVGRQMTASLDASISVDGPKQVAQLNAAVLYGRAPVSTSLSAHIAGTLAVTSQASAAVATTIPLTAGLSVSIVTPVTLTQTLNKDLVGYPSAVFKGRNILLFIPTAGEIRSSVALSVVVSEQKVNPATVSAAIAALTSAASSLDTLIQAGATRSSSVGTAVLRDASAGLLFSTYISVSDQEVVECSAAILESKAATSGVSSVVEVQRAVSSSLSAIIGSLSLIATSELGTSIATHTSASTELSVSILYRRLRVYQAPGENRTYRANGENRKYKADKLS